MERPLEKHLDETFKIPGVSGVLCADENGLCLGAKGVAKKEAAGHITSIALSAAKLIPNSNTNPVICIEGETGSVLIKKEENIVMAVYKSQA
ncbi:hypothetical protein CHS0354_030962 [Potamilus streckersoni]|uniref:Late endosomal/lysosomal adaptor and MAPK and MTOR activator 5 n=1 Tax=Potamilus streckersoni TaxID=2493646 RepID=A0AAE0VU33_9BIVA|nr:hypothetical protein CHS0354_030962 [Potamilus streckersoni]